MVVATQMATIPTLVLALKAGADLSSDQHKFVKLNADNQVILPTAITDKVIGVLQNKPDASGKGAEVLVIGVTKVQADEALAAGDIISPGTDGQAAIAAATAFPAGQVIIGASAAGEIAEAVISCVNLTLFG